MKMILKTMVCLAVAFSGTAGAANYSPEKSQASLALKVPGNPAVEYPLTLSKLSDSYFDYEWKAKEKIPVTIFQQISTVDDKQQVTVVLTAMEDVTNQNGDLIATFESSVFRKDQKVPFEVQE